MKGKSVLAFAILTAGIFGLGDADGHSQGRCAKMCGPELIAECAIHVYGACVPQEPIGVWFWCTRC